MSIKLQMINQQQNLLVKYAKKIRNLQHFEKILQREDITFDYKPFKIEKLTPEKALIKYKNLLKRYNDSKQPPKAPDVWYEYQKRIFVWFMVIYSYYLEKEYSTLKKPSDYKEKINFETLLRIFFNKSALFLEFQFLNLFKVTEKILWTVKEDAILNAAVEKCEQGKWTQVSMEIFKMTGKEMFILSKYCSYRWQNHLDNSMVKGNWTQEEDRRIIQFAMESGKKWSKMKTVLDNKRTEHTIKNRYHSLITKNRTHRHDKQLQIAKRIQQRYKKVPKDDVDQEQQNEIVDEKAEENKACFKFKQQSLSDIAQEQSQAKSQHLEKVQFPVKEEAINQNTIKQANHININQKQLKKADVKYEDDEYDELMGFFPFENYNYALFDQYYDMQNAHYAIFCQQYMLNVVPTNDTYIPQNSSLPKQQAEQQGKRRV